jgi:hypothetical protein
MHLNETGLAAKRAGGRLKYEENIRIEKERASEKLKVDLRISKFTYKTYWWLFWISVASFAISLTALWLTLLQKKS